MQDLIASYLIQKKECQLPLLGNFIIKPGITSLDIANKKIYPSIDEIIFIEKSDYFSDGLKYYISHLHNIPLQEAEDKMNNWCLHAKVKLDAGEKIDFDTLGSLKKDEAGNVIFQREKVINFYEPVTAERVIHKNTEHAVLVGDKETTSFAMNEFYKEDTVLEKRLAWKIPTLILFIICLFILIIYFYNHPFSKDGIANQSTFPVKQSLPTYRISR